MRGDDTDRRGFEAKHIPGDRHDHASVRNDGDFVTVVERFREIGEGREDPFAKDGHALSSTDRDVLTCKERLQLPRKLLTNLLARQTLPRADTEFAPPGIRLWISDCLRRCHGASEVRCDQSTGRVVREPLSQS